MCRQQIHYGGYRVIYHHPKWKKKRMLAKTDLAPDSFELGFSSWEGARKKCTSKDSVQKTFIAKWIPFRALGPAL
jgi:hypothetical protein